MKRFITKKQLDELVESLNSVVSKSDCRQLSKIGEKYGLVLNQDRRTNLNLWWRKIVEMLEALPSSHKFRISLHERELWRPGRFEPETIKEFIKHLRVDDEYKLLCSKMWEDLEFALYMVKHYNIPTIGLKTFIELKGDVYDHFSQYTEAFADPAALKFSKQLKKEIDKMFEKITPEERQGAVNALLTYVNKGLQMSEEEFHNEIFKYE